MLSFISLGLRRRRRVDGTSGTVGLLPADVVAGVAGRRHPMVAHGPPAMAVAARSLHRTPGPDRASALAGIAAVLNGRPGLATP